jgi:hypothetical protein
MVAVSTPTKKNSMTKKFMFAMVLLGVTTVAFAKKVNGSEFKVIKSKAPSVFNVMYQSDEKSLVKVSITNEQGEILFKESIRNTDGFVRPYNLSSLPEGKYVVNVDNGNSNRAETISYRIAHPSKTVNIIKLKSDENKVALTIASAGKDELTISILDEQSNLVYSESISVKGEFGQIYNLKELKSYTIQVSDGSGLLKSVSYK